MALMWADGFDHYGGVTARLLDGVYSDISGVTLSAANPRTGGYAMRVQVVNNSSGARRVLPGETTKVGFGYAFNLSALPTDAYGLMLGQFLTKENAVLLTVSVYPTGAVAVRQGGWQSPVVRLSGPEIIMPGSYQHFECSLDDSNLEIRGQWCNRPEYDGSAGACSNRADLCGRWLWISEDRRKRHYGC